MGEFQWYAGLGVRVVKDVTTSLGLQPAEPGSDRLLLADDVDAWRAFKAPKESRPVLVSSLDPILATRRELGTLLDPADADRRIAGDKALITVGGVADLPNHAILDRGRLIGVWEYDPAAQAIVYSTFVKRNAAIEKAVRRTTEFVRDQLGDARSFSLDSPKSRVPRIEALRSLG